MATGGRTVFIAGAGIAGLTLALALAKFGTTVVVLERGKAIQELGAGLQISPNARRILNQLGLDKAITARSFEPEGIDVYPFRAAGPLVSLELGAAARQHFGVPYAVMHRADLADALARACRRFANIDLVFGVQHFDVASHARGLSILADEGAGKSRNGRAFAFVGADGINSPTRTGILDGPAAKPSGMVAWRALVESASLEGVISLDRTSLLFGPGYHAVCYPLPHRGRVNIVLITSDKAAQGKSDALNRAPNLGASLRSDRRFATLLASAADNWGVWPLGTVETDTWHEGSVGLIGDAAHAMLPFQAQGAAMAIEDAAILAPLLMTEPTAGAAFGRYYNLRRKRVARVAALSVSNGRAFHLAWPLSLARDTILGLQGSTGHFRRLDWLYGYDAAPEAEIGAPTRPS
ncbi:MAG TPA: FAD-dependent monooxygenase [Devosiaceae bacterium]|jgi:salicylate hydroxylase